MFKNEIHKISAKTKEILYELDLPDNLKKTLAEKYKVSNDNLTKELNRKRDIFGDLKQNEIADTKYTKRNQYNSNQLEKLINVREQVLNNLNYTLATKSNTESNFEIQNDILDSEINLVHELTNEISRLIPKEGKEDYYKSWRVLRNSFEHQYQRLSLNNHSDSKRFESAIRYMSQRGQGEDLVNIQNIKDNIDSSQKEFIELIKTAEQNICDRERKNQTIFGKYRIFVSNKYNLDKSCPMIKIELVYPAFSIVLATEQTFNQLKEYFPIELLEQLNDPCEIIDRSNHKQKEPENEKIMSYYLVVKFDTPIPRNWKELIRDTQAEVIKPIGGSQAVVYADNHEIVNRIRELDQVREVTPHEPKIKVRTEYLGENLKQSVTKEELVKVQLHAARNPRRSRKKNIPVPGILIASFFTETARNRAANDLIERGIRVADRPGNRTLVLDVGNLKNPVESLAIIGNQQGLSSLEEKIIPTLFNIIFNNAARKLIGQEVIPANPTPNDTSLGLTGKGEIVAVADTGLDTGEIETLHLDFQDRVEVIQSLPITTFRREHIKNFEEEEQEASDRHSGHGTHVAGSILGNGEQAKVFGEKSPPTGVAPEAKLIFQAVEKTPKWTQEGKEFYLSKYYQDPPKSALLGIPDALQDLFQPAYDKGARIHSNSWGGGYPGVYSKKCQDLDEFVWKHKDFLVIVAAGNEGEQTHSGTPAIDQESIAAPAVAKNCLTVGASENNRRGQFLDTYGQRKCESFPYPPFKDKSLVDNIEDIAAFSSRGPCDDGRCKPDLVAPGTFVLSTRSSQIAENNFAEGYYSPAKNDYMYMSGTSMATPLVAGCAALVRQYLREIKSIENPTAALVKATLIHSAQYMNYSYPHPNSAPWADDEQGWGRVDLRTVLNPENPTQVIFIDRSQGLNTGDGHEYKLEVVDNTVMLRVTLVYTDYPGDRGDEQHLVNNLNLTLYPPSDEYRQYYQGNDFKNTGKIDNCNNVEGCIIKPTELQTGTWTVKVVGSLVPEAPQDYALVISGGIDPKFEQIA